MTLERLLKAKVLVVVARVGSVSPISLNVLPTIEVPRRRRLSTKAMVEFDAVRSRLELIIQPASAGSGGRYRVPAGEAATAALMAGALSYTIVELVTELDAALARTRLVVPAPDAMVVTR